MSRLRLLTLFALLASALSFPPMANALCEPLPDLADAIAAAPLVFVGTVRGITDLQSTAVFTVEEIWRGPNLPSTVTVVRSAPPQGNVTWVVGRRYLVFIWAGPDGELMDASGHLQERTCSLTSVYQPAFDALRPANAHPPQGPPTSGVPGSPPIAAIFLAIVLLGSIGAFFLYRTRPPLR